MILILLATNLLRKGMLKKPFLHLTGLLCCTLQCVHNYFQRRCNMTLTVFTSSSKASRKSQVRSSMICLSALSCLCRPAVGWLPEAGVFPSMHVPHSFPAADFYSYRFCLDQSYSCLDSFQRLAFLSMVSGSCIHKEFLHIPLWHSARYHRYH